MSQKILSRFRDFALFEAISHGFIENFKELFLKSWLGMVFAIDKAKTMLTKKNE
jgi:hypothetical protein